MAQENDSQHVSRSGNNESRGESSRSVREDFEKLVRLFRKNSIVYAPNINGSVHNADPKSK